MCIFSLNTFADFSLTCPEIYRKTLIHKDLTSRKINNVAYKATQVSTLLLLSGNPLVFAALAPAIVVAGYTKNHSSKEQRIDDLMSEGNRRLERLTKKLQKNISSDINEEEIVSLIEDGMKSGLFCKRFPELYSPKDVKEYVKKSLELKYAARQ